MREWQTFADVLCPRRHATKRKHVAGQQQRRQKKEERHLHRLQLVLGDGRERNAHREVSENEHQRQHQQQRHAAHHRHGEHQFGRQQNECDLDVANRDIRHDFSEQHFARMHRRGEQVFHRAALAFARDGQAGDHHHRHRQHHAHEAGHDVVLADAFGIVKLVRDQIERRRTAAQFRQRPGQIAIQHGDRQRIDRRRGKADRRRIGCVGFEQQIRFFATQQFAGKIHRHGHGELHLAFREHGFDFRRTMGFACDVKITAVVQRPNESARERAVIGREHSGGQMFRV